MSEDFVYKSKKRDWFTAIFREPGYAFIKWKFHVYYNHLERLHDVSDQSFVLIPKHQHLYDIFLEGIVLNRAIQRNGHYIMKEELPKICEWMGGIPIVRTFDVTTKRKQDMTRDEVRQQLKEAKERSKYVNQVITYLLNNNEIVVTHPEITRNYQKRGDETTVRNNLAKLLHLQKKNGRPITFVPLDFYYEDVKTRGSDIIITVGNPIQVPDDGIDELVVHMANQIELLF